MRILASLVVSLALLAGCASQQRVDDPGARFSPDDAPPLQSTAGDAESLDEMLERDDFNLARALLLFSEKYYPEFKGAPHDVDVSAKLARFDKYVEELRRELRRDRSPRQRVRTLIDFVHLKLGLRFDTTDDGGEKPDNLFFDRVLQTRYGYCVTLSLAYLVFGQAAGLDVQGVRFPGHFAVMFNDVDVDGTPYEVILESTDFGDVRDELAYWSEYRFSVTAVENEVYLSSLTDRQVFGTLYNNLAGITYLRGDHELAVERYSRALELAPNNAEALYNRAIVERGLDRPRNALRDLNEALRLDPNFVLALLARAGLLWENEEREAAHKDLGDAMRKRPDWPEPWLLDGMFLAESGQVDKARASFERALEIDPKFNSAHIALADLERKLGNEARAREHEEAAGIR